MFPAFALKNISSNENSELKEEGLKKFKYLQNAYSLEELKGNSEEEFKKEKDIKKYGEMEKIVLFPNIHERRQKQSF